MGVSVAPGVEMWVQGDEDGGVSIVCTQESCMQDGPVAEHNPRGLYWNPIPVLPWRPSPSDIREAFDKHLAHH